MDPRRSLRGSEPGAKKPRLINDLDRGSVLDPRRLPQRASGHGGDDGGGYHPQPPPHQELVVQYKTALAELTFNSKPIITNLTIIAGENLAAAKAVAGIVCSNILEVPSDQKLPSLYLLDSIVKNIGRDYIKHFATRLPEVFCEAYRQVDPPVHSNMRHLFGTWKGVFPTQTLQMIEKELGFTSTANGSASASASVRSDSQSQRPPNSIHVNPKYLERHQQSIKTKGGVNDMNGAILKSKGDPERVLGSGRPPLDPRVTMQNNQRTNRDAFNDSVPEKSIGESFGGNEYSSDTSSNLSLVGRTGGRITELGYNKPWYKAGGGFAETRSGQGNGFSVKPGFSNHEALKSVKLDAHRQPALNIANKRSSMMSSNWKNSEEEEFTWDEMNSGLTGHGALNVSDNLSTDTWTSDDENLEGEDHLQIAQISNFKKQRPVFAGHQSLSWKMQDQHSIDKLKLKPGHSKELLSTLGGFQTNTNSLSIGMGNRPFMPNATIGMAEVMRQQQFDSGGAESPSGQSPLREQSPSPPRIVRNPHPVRSLAEQDRSHSLKTSQYLKALPSQHIKDPLPALPPNVQVGHLRKSQERDLQDPLSSATSFQPRLQQQKLGPSQTDVTVKTKKPPQSKVTLARETSEQLTSSSLSAAAVKSGTLSNKSTTSSVHTTSSLDKRNLKPKFGVRPTQSSGPSPTTLISSVSVVALPSSLGPSNSDSPTLPKLPQRKAGQPQRVSTQLPASSNVSNASNTTSNASTSNTSNPIANLLSSLVAKGLISSETESPTKVPTEMPSRLEDQTESVAASSSLPVVPVSVSAAVPVSSSRDEVDDTTIPTLALSKSTSTEFINLIGFDFKPDIIREMHPHVISALLDDLPHHCTVCGIRLKLQEQFDRHLEWHAAREREHSGLIMASRKWYAKSNDWIAGKAEYPSECELTDSVDVYDNETEENQLDTMVLADENQCLCVLCGEVFEDVYCHERDAWMFKGAVYLNNTDGDGDSEIENRNLGPIIHARCLSENPISSVT